MATKTESNYRGSRTFASKVAPWIVGVRPDPRSTWSAATAARSKATHSPTPARAATRSKQRGLRRDRDPAESLRERRHTRDPTRREHFLQYFRPPIGSAPHPEARDITVEGNTILGSEAAIAFVGVDGAIVRFNTIHVPHKWAIRILQESAGPGFPLPQWALHRQRRRLRVAALGRRWDQRRPRHRARELRLRA